MNLRRLASAVRHAPVLNRANWLWNVVRPTYQRLLDPCRKGVAIKLGNTAKIRMPAEFTSSANWESYEPAAIKRASEWLMDHPEGLLLDVGSAIGIYSLLALSASSSTLAIAFDSDLSALKSTERMCTHAGADRLHLVHGFVSNRHQSGWTLRKAYESTLAQIAINHITGAPGTNRYICLQGGAHPDEIPVHSLDALVVNERRLILLKIDIEGAEFLALEGCNTLLSKCRPQLLLSVHPRALSEYGHTVNELREFLMSHGYVIELLSIDHEEHWWCTPA